MRELLFTRYNTERNNEFQIQTTIYREGDECYVEKTALTSDATLHVKQIYKNYTLISSMNKKVKYVKPEFNNGILRYPFIQGKSIDSMLFEDIYGDIWTAISKLKGIINDLFDYSDEYYCDFQITDGYRRVFGDTPGIKSKWICRANIDLVIDNVIIIDNSLVSFDYEWVFDFPIPVDYIKFRTLQLFYFKYGMYLGHRISYHEYMSQFDLSFEQVEIYGTMEANFLNYVTGQSKSYMHQYAKVRTPIKQIIQERNLYKMQAEKREHELSTIVDGFNCLSQIVKEKTENTQL